MRKTPSLAHVAILSELPPDAQTAVLARCVWRRYGRGESILAHDDASLDVYFLVEGAARAVLYASSGKRVSYRDMLPGSLFGEIAAIDGGPRSVSVEANEDCVVLVLPAKAFWDTIAAYPEFAKAVMQRMALYVRDLTQRVFEFSTLAAKNRLHAELLRLAGETAPDDRRVEIKSLPTHAELANRLSTHREGVSRELSRLTEIGAIERSGPKSLVIDVARLTHLIRETQAD